MIVLFRLNTSELIKMLVGRCGPEDDTDLWYILFLHVLLKFNSFANS